MDIPKIKKRIYDFIVEEDGRVTKESILKMGAIAGIAILAGIKDVDAAYNRDSPPAKCEIKAEDVGPGFEVIAAEHTIKGTTTPGFYYQSANPCKDKGDNVADDTSYEITCKAWLHQNSIKFDKEDDVTIKATHAHDIQIKTDKTYDLKANVTSSGTACSFTSDTSIG